MTRRTGPGAAVVRLVRERDGWRCVRCGGRGHLTTHHRIARGMGGTTDAAINVPSNLLTLCMGPGTQNCHSWVEAHPLEAREFGWSLRRGQDPAGVPLVTFEGVWLQLHADGGWTAELGCAVRDSNSEPFDSEPGRVGA